MTMKHSKFKLQLLIIVLLFIMSTPVFAQSSEDWYEIKGIYTKEGGDANRSDTLSLMYLDNDVVMFEFLMMSDESEGVIGNNFCLASALLVEESGIGVYDHPKTGDVKITFTIKENSIVVVQTGKLPMDLSGTYKFSKASIKVTEQAAIEILEQLAPAATSLNSYNSDYELVLSNDQVDGWFYEVKAFTKGTEDVFAEFYIAADMSSVYRVDTDVPMIIWGSAQSLMDSTYRIDSDALYGVTVVEETVQDATEVESSESDSLEAEYVTASLEQDELAVGESTKINVSIPGDLEYFVTYESSDPNKVKVDEAGNVTALADGTCTIFATITIDDAEKSFELIVNPERQNIEITNVKKTFDVKKIALIAVPIIVIVGIVIFLLLKNMKKKNKNKK